MSVRRQNHQPMLPFTRMETGEARTLPRQGVEAPTTPSGHERPVTFDAMMMEAICSTENLRTSLRKVIANKGAAGVDGMTVRELEHHWKRHGPEIVSQLLSGTYRPMPVRRVEIPKPDGGVRKLGIPTVLDRLIQQAMLSVLQDVFEPTFSEHSYGFRPGRSAHQAVKQAKAYIAEGRSWVVDIDLEKFFDQVNHDKLMALVAKRITDKRVLRLIRAYLNAGVMEGGLVSQTERGTPQGGPLSPLLSNIALDPLDKELQQRGHAFVRYADDCNIYVRSERAGQRVMEGVTDFITRKLKLKVNRDKSAVDKPGRRKFLGFTFSEKRATVLVSKKAKARFKDRVRELTRRGRPALQIIEDLNTFLRGWMGYFGTSEAYWDFRDLDSWIRRRLRALAWRAWRTSRKRYRSLIRRGADPLQASRVVRYRNSPWRASKTIAVSKALPDRLWKQLGLFSLLESWHAMRTQP
jgi:RNA-directed DNA polymerase